MITYRYFIIVLLFTTSVLSRNTNRGNTRHSQPDENYKYNHPPEPESYESIPVAVLYEEDSNRNEKAIKSDISTKNNVAQVNKEPLKSDSNIGNGSSATEEQNIDHHVVSTPVQALEEDQKSNGKVPDNPTAQISEQEQQIPVAVIYELEASYHNEPRPKVQRVSSKRRKVRPVKEEQIEEEKKSESSVNENEDSAKSRVPNIPVTQERFSSHDKSTPTPASNVRVTDTQERFNGPDKSTPTPAPNDRVSYKQERFNSRDKSTPTPASNVRVTDTQERFNSPDKSTPIPAPNDRVSHTQERFNSRDKSTPTPASDVRVSDTQEQFSNSGASVPVQSFAKRDNSTRHREVVPIIQSENLVFSHTGDFQYSYEAGDGTKAFEKGQLKTFEDENAGEAVSGGFSYTAKDGNEYSLSYTADENGYRPVGAHLPTPPPIPPAIARALAYLATKPTPEPVTESLYEADYS